MSSEMDPGQGPGQESKQFCSVCKEWLAMEIVPTGDGEDDGVVWYRCPRCQGFLPKLKSAVEESGSAGQKASAAAPDRDSASAPAEDLDADLPYDSPAEMMAAQQSTADPAAAADADTAVDGDLASDLPLVEDPENLAPVSVDPEAVAPVATPSSAKESAGDQDPEVAAEPIAEYAAQLAAALAELPPDAPGGRPYRPWETYEVGQCIQHLAWEDCGIVVGKEELPGGRQVIKAYFQAAGVVRLIEQAPR